MEDRFAETALFADWVGMIFLHFEVDHDELQKVVPFTLDLFEGKAYVSLVAFTMDRMRPAVGGRATEWLTKPITTHQFLNLRTYVKHRGSTGIFFMKEWLNDRLAVMLGPGTFGLPYHYATIDYLNDEHSCAGRVVDKQGEFAYEGRKAEGLAPALPGSRNAFFLERYTAFTNAGRRPQFFRVWHPPWRFGMVKGFTLKNGTLFRNSGERWTGTAKLADVHWSPGVFDVWMGRSHAVA